MVRCAAGAVMLLRPRTVVGVLGGDPGLSPAGDWAVRMLGAREVALGAGVLVAGRDRSGLWLLAGGLSDAVDTVVLVVGRGVRPPGAHACHAGGGGPVRRRGGRRGGRPGARRGALSSRGRPID